jgi:hypothetical protein
LGEGQCGIGYITSQIRLRYKEPRCLYSIIAPKPALLRQFPQKREKYRGRRKGHTSKDSRPTKKVHQKTKKTRLYPFSFGLRRFDAAFGWLFFFNFVCVHIHSCHAWLGPVDESAFFVTLPGTVLRCRCQLAFCQGDNLAKLLKDGARLPTISFTFRFIHAIWV